MKYMYIVYTMQYAHMQECLKKVWYLLKIEKWKEERHDRKKSHESEDV